MASRISEEVLDQRPRFGSLCSLFQFLERKSKAYCDVHSTGKTQNSLENTETCRKREASISTIRRKAFLRRNYIVE